MIEEPIHGSIKEKIDKLGYNSAKFQLAIVKESELWKIMMVRIIFDIANPQERKTLVDENNFVLENVWLSVEDFKRFLDYLKKVYVGNITFKGDRVEITDELLFSIGNYKLCFVGNFPSRELYFYGRQKASTYHGIDKPIYFTDYALHGSVTAQSYPQIDLTYHEPPFRDVIEAVNYYWNTNYEKYSSGSIGCRLYMPILDASIASCEFNGQVMTVKVDMEKSRTKLEELSIAAILQGKGNIYRKKHDLRSNYLKIDLGFTPNSGSVILNRHKEKLDEYSYYSSVVDQTLDLLNRDRARMRAVESGNEIDLETEIDQEFLFDQALTANLPEQIQSLLAEAEIAFKHSLHRATAILLRSALEEGITLLIRRSDRQKDLYENGFEIGLQKKIRLLTDSAPQFRQIKTELDDVKWFGDKASHEASMPIYKNDISGNIAPKLRLFLSKLIEDSG